MSNRISRVALEASQLNDGETDWVEATATIERPGETDPETAMEFLSMSPSEMRALYERMRTYYRTGCWTTGTVTR